MNFIHIPCTLNEKINQAKNAVLQFLISNFQPSPSTLSVACGGLIRNVTVGQIMSPGFPSNYSNNLTCHWLLEAPEGQRLHIHFEKVALAEDDDR